jgi:hypothetical protein
MQRQERGRKEPSEFNVIVKCKDLIKHTFTITNSTERFPKKYRFTLVNRIRKVRRRSKNNMKRKLKKMRGLVERGKITTATVEQSYKSWRGHAEKGNCYHLIRRTDHYYNRLFNSKEAEKCQKQ